MLKQESQTISHKLIGAIFTSKVSSYLSPLIELLVSLGFINVWEGIYSCWEDARQDSNIFEEKIWINKLTNQVQKNITDYRSKNNSHLAPPAQDHILSLAAGVLFSPSEDNLQVLDFGGGLGTSYFRLISSLPESKKVEFHIVELKIICDLAQNFLGDFPQLHFYKTLPNLSKPVHIIHLGSSIQYAPDWKDLLAKLANYRSHILILEELPAGDIPSFISTQNYYGKKLQCHFFNINELIEEVQTLGYELIYKSRCPQNYAGKPGEPLPMKNFPSQFRLDFFSNLMFKRIKH